MAKTVTTRRNRAAQDATLINLRALKARVRRIEQVLHRHHLDPNCPACRRHQNHVSS